MSATTEMNVKIGDFSFIKDPMWSYMCQDMFDAITAADAWADVAKDPGDGGFMFSNAPFIGRVQEQMRYDGHSGASFAITMRAMQSIARNGWTPWVAENMTSQAEKANS